METVSEETKKCPECALDVPAVAKTCGHCRASFRAVHISLGQVAGAGLILILAFLFLASYAG